nr:MFS transporter [Deinobacterium chartae]
MSDAQRQRALLSVLISNFLMWAGFFMVVPLISVHYVDGLGWAAAGIGLVLAVRQLVQQGFSLIGGVLGDRFGARGMILLGLLVRALGFGAMAFADNYALLMASAALAAFGGALFEAPKSAAVAALTQPRDRQRFYAALGVSSNLGMSLGPLVGSLLLGVGFANVALVSAACYVLSCGLVATMLPPVRISSGTVGTRSGMQLVLRDRPFLLFIALLTGYWFMWVQLSLSFPLAAKELSGAASAVSLVFAVNSGLALLLQVPVTRVAERFLRPLQSLCLGMLLMSAGLGGVALSHSLAALVACVVLFSLGALLASPSQQTLTADLAKPEAMGAFFGVAALSLAVGGSLGNYAGGALHDLGSRSGLPALPWLASALIGVVSAAALYARFGRAARSAPERPTHQKV